MRNAPCTRDIESNLLPLHPTLSIPIVEQNSVTIMEKRRPGSVTSQELIFSRGPESGPSMQEKTWSTPLAQMNKIRVKNEKQKKKKKIGVSVYGSQFL
jgi:hypothetical protein